ncbi:MAG: hypothetical protein Q8K58_06015 [Acidimicrobiales bacterium]|nr:hypothetical protein [Acidimicrobiales bacterium]
MRLRRILPVLAFGAVGVALGVAAVLALKEATLSTHHRVDPKTTAVVTLDARSKGAERGRSLGDMVETLLLACRLEVARTEMEGPVRELGSGRYEATFRPMLDETNQRQLRGCLEDWSIDHILIDVVSIRSA